MSDKENNLCLEHREEISLYCLDCEDIVCLDCLTERHTRHRVQVKLYLHRTKAMFSESLNKLIAIISTIIPMTTKSGVIITFIMVYGNERGETKLALTRETSIENIIRETMSHT